MVLMLIMNSSVLLLVIIAILNIVAFIYIRDRSYIWYKDILKRIKKLEEQLNNKK